MTIPLAGALRGGVAGIAATAAMSGVMLAAQRLGAVGNQPPEAIVDETLAKAGADADEATSDVLGVVAHLAFGTTVGATYGALAEVAGPSARGPLPATAFALLVWLTSYQGWIPALGALPPASRDRRDRQVSIVAAHIVYGAVLGTLTNRAGRSAVTRAGRRG